MNESEPPAANAYLHLPPGVAAVGILVVLAGLLAVGLWANANLRPQGTSVPSPTPVAVAPATSAKPNVAAPGPMREETPAPIASTSSFVAPTIAPTTVPTALPSTLSTPRPTALDQQLVDDILSAFNRYWDVRKEALLNLDKTHLSEVMGGDHLSVISNRIDELRSENRAILTNVDHDIRVISVDSENSQVADDYISNSVYVDPVSKEPVTDPTSDELRVLYTMRRLEGAWKVIDSVEAN